MSITCLLASSSCITPSAQALFPLLLINIGSGVSVLRVDGLQTMPNGDQVPAAHSFNSSLSLGALPHHFPPFFGAPAPLLAPGSISVDVLA